MVKNNPQQRIIIKRKLEQQLQKAYNIKPEIGIYMFYRIVAYIGKSAEKNGILGRCASHCMSHEQHIDNSIATRKMSYMGGQWFLKPLIYCSKEEVDKYEREFIDKYNGTYELLNKESGGTLGKEIINERKEPKGYKKGVEYGYLKAKKEVHHYFDKYLTYSLKGKPSVNGQKAMDKFAEFLKVE